MLAVLSLGMLAASCGGGGDPIVIGELLATFTPDQPSGGARISMEDGPSSGDVFTVEIHSNGFTDLYGAAFTLLYDSNDATYLGCEAAGSILTTSGAATIPCDGVLVGGAEFRAELQNGVPGFINVLASRQGLVPGVPNGTGLLLALSFQANGEIPPPGERFDFEAGSSREVEICPQDLSPCSTPTVPWDGGTLTATNL
jgi:hypothetical protein